MPSAIASRRTFIRSLASLAIAGPTISSAKDSVKAAAPPPVDPTVVFKIGGNIGSGYDYTTAQGFTDSSKVIRGFGVVGDAFRNTVARPKLDPVDRYPAEDFALTIPQQALETFEQRLKCRILGLATLQLGNLAGATLENVVDRGDVTTFEIVLAPNVQGFAILTCTNTRRTAASAVNTGIRGLTIRVHGYALDDPTVVMPNPKFAWSQYSTLRMHDFTRTGDDYYQITPADRATDTRRAKEWGISNLVVRSVEEACRVCNECGTNLWYNMPAAANDAYVTEVATVIRTLLNPGKYCLFEMSNENWNYTFEQHDWWMQRTMEVVDGATFQYVHSKKAKYYSRTSNVITVETCEPHGIQVGDKVRVSTPSYLTVVCTAVPTPTSWSYANTGADLAPTKPLRTAFWRAGRCLHSATRLGTVMTLEFGHDHGWSPGQTMRISGVPGLASSGTIHTVASVPSARTITLPCTAGTDGPIALGGSTSVVAKFDSYLNAHDGDWDQFRLQRRLYARRTVEMSNLIRAVYAPAEWGVRAKIGLFNQPGASQYDQMKYIVAQHGQPNRFLHGMGQATYFFLDATKVGGPNLRNVSTYNGHTPPLVTDYTAVMAQTCAAQKTSRFKNWDETCQVSSDYGLKMWQYEFGPDITGSPVNTASVEARTNKMNALFDPSLKPAYRGLLDDIEAAGFEEIMVYQLGTVTLPTSDEYSSWPIYQRFTEPSVRSEAIVEKLASPRTGPTRNLLGISGTTEISGKRTIGIYDDTAATFPTVVPGSTGTWRGWIITAPEAGNWNLSMEVESTNGVRDWFLKVNTVRSTPALATPGTGIFSSTPRVVALRKGINHIVTEFSSVYGGTYLTLRKFIFTRV